MEKIFNPEQAAEVLSVTKQTIRKWLREGLLTGVKLDGKSWRVTESDINEFIKRNRETTNDARLFESLIDFDLINQCKQSDMNIYEYCKQNINADIYHFFTGISENEAAELNKKFLVYVKLNYNSIPTNE